MGYLPKGYTSTPKISNYLDKLEQGDTKIRILCKDPIAGWQEFEERADKSRKKHCYPLNPPPENTITGKLKYFCANIVWNYNVSMIQIMSIDKSGLISELNKLNEDADLGGICNFDIKLNRTGEGIGSRYSLKAMPPKPLERFIKEAFLRKPIYLDALLTCEDPFIPNLNMERTRAFFEEDTMSIGRKSKTFTTDQCQEIADMLGYNPQLMERVCKYYGVEKIHDLDSSLYEEIVKIAASYKSEVVNG